MRARLGGEASLHPRVMAALMSFSFLIESAQAAAGLHLLARSVLRRCKRVAAESACCRRRRCLLVWAMLHGAWPEMALL